MSAPLPEFDDPQLKATVRRACGAPARTELRHRIAELVHRETARAELPPPSAVPVAAREPAGSAVRIAPPSRRIGRWALAAAALILAAVGIGPTVWHRYQAAHEHAEELAANLPLFEEMTRAYDAAPATPAESLPTTDRGALRAALSAKLGRPVPVPDWRDKGWQLTTATVTPVGTHSAAQLRYQNGGRTLLFLSLPAAAYKEPEGEHDESHAHDAAPEVYQFTVNRHPITGFVKDGGLHCTIGDPTATKGELAGLKVD